VKIVYALPFVPVLRSRSILGLGLPSSANGKRSISFNYELSEELRYVTDKQTLTTITDTVLE